MVLSLAFTLVERFGFGLVLATYLALSVVNQGVFTLRSNPPPILFLSQVGALGMGAVAIWTAYRLVRTALPDCGLMALATAAFLAVLPAHVAALGSLRLASAEVAVNVGLIVLASRARASVLQRRDTWAAQALAATRSATGGSQVLSSPPARGRSPVREAKGLAAFLLLAVPAFWVVQAGPAAGFRDLWLPPRWSIGSADGAIIALLAVVAIVGLAGSVRYGLDVARREAGLTEPERNAFAVFYLVAGATLASMLLLALLGRMSPGLFHLFLAPIALLGLIGFESWSPPVVRPLIVFGLLVAFFSLNIAGALA